MTAHLLVALTAAFAAFLTLYSGFGLGTLLLPVFALFFPVEVAVAATTPPNGICTLRVLGDDSADLDAVSSGRRSARGDVG